MKRILRTALVMLLTVALLLPTLAVQASAASYKWNGTSTLKSGKSYVITSAVVMDSKFTIPEGAKLTVSKNGTLTISKGVTATVNGTLAVSKGGTLKVNGTLNATESSAVKISGKLTYGASAKLGINGTLTVASTGTISGSGTAEVNLSAKSQYNSDVEKINTYLEKGNYSKACSLLESAITAYPDKASSLRAAYSSAVIEWADQLGDEKDYAKACSILNSAKKYLKDTTDVENRYNFYQGYIPVPLSSLTNYGHDRGFGIHTDTFNNTYHNSVVGGASTGTTSLEYILDGKYTNLTGIIACNQHYYTVENYVEVYVDGVCVYVSDYITKTTKPIEINVDITGAQTLTIKTTVFDSIILADLTVYKE